MSKFGFYQETGTAYYRKSINPIIARKRKKKKQHGHPVGAESADGAAPRCTKALALNLLPPGDIGTAPDTPGTRTAAPPPPPTRGRGHLAPGLPGASTRPARSSLWRDKTAKGTNNEQGHQVRDTDARAGPAGTRHWALAPSLQRRGAPREPARSRGSHGLASWFQPTRKRVGEDWRGCL